MSPSSIQPTCLLLTTARSHALDGDGMGDLDHRFDHLDDRRMCCLDYFLRAGSPDAGDILYRVHMTSDLRSFSSRSVDAVQQGKIIFKMQVQFCLWNGRAHRGAPGLSASSYNRYLLTQTNPLGHAATARRDDLRAALLC